MAVGFVRPARPDDAGEIARIQVATWRVAYRRLLPRQVLDGLEEPLLAERWLEAITAPPSKAHRVLIAVDQTGDEKMEAPDQSYVVGFLASGPADENALAPDEDHTALGEDVAAITEMLVEPRWGRRGHGSRLLAASVDLWRESGLRMGVAWSFEADSATTKFLTSAGWAPDGATRALDVEDMLVPQLRLHAAL
ncbi:GNAT superfamily N-acetyltransferase [Allocatelliglobosispora scoriae]|uniref:GNAT superfamily N-acetyltransferase n=1 Tax=Allocatelliglobosispora scoriae TaxID=643052 RepID=A0A841BXT2_9ACTN|nr:GNAT family N-acetyltransferase [Allocatelliglobosispora scoriae]MBB5872298.1 GNAT superfamily N-acetyltransferase [Allocatelliglobosispora scoriae]